MGLAATHMWPGCIHCRDHAVHNKALSISAVSATQSSCCCRCATWTRAAAGMRAMCRRRWGSQTFLTPTTQSFSYTPCTLVNTATCSLSASSYMTRVQPAPLLWHRTAVAFQSAKSYSACLLPPSSRCISLEGCMLLRIHQVRGQSALLQGSAIDMHACYCAPL